MTQQKRVLLVDDEVSIQRSLSSLLRSRGYAVDIAPSGESALKAISDRPPDLVLLDLGLPLLDGGEVCRRVRDVSPVPIIILTARNNETEKVSLLDIGADDYVTKPFSAPELLARVRAALRRSARGGEQLPSLKFADLTVDLTRREVELANGGDPANVHLTPLEYRVLECLARQAGLIVTQTQLIREVWGPERLGDTRSLRVCMKNLRAKLEPDPKRPRYLITEAGLGYRLRTED